MGDSELTIILEKEVYSPGDVIKGTIRLAAATDVDLKDGIQLDITGVAMTEWSQLKRLTTGKPSKEQELKSRTIVLFEEHTVIGKSAGAQKDFPFTYRIPITIREYRELPMKCSFRASGVDAFVKYAVLATTKTPNLRAEAEFDIVTPVDMIPEGNLPLEKIERIEPAKRPCGCLCHCCCSKSYYGPINMKATVTPQAAYPGVVVSALVKVDNQSGVDFEYVLITFEETMVCRTNYDEKSYTCKVIFQMKIERVKAGAEESRQLHLQVPHDALPTQKMCAIIEHVYVLSVRPQLVSGCCKGDGKVLPLVVPIFVASLGNQGLEPVAKPSAKSLS